MELSNKKRMNYLMLLLKLLKRLQLNKINLFNINCNSPPLT